MGVSPSASGSVPIFDTVSDAIAFDTVSDAMVKVPSIVAAVGEAINVAGDDSTFLEEGDVASGRRDVGPRGPTPTVPVSPTVNSSKKLPIN